MKRIYIQILSFFIQNPVLTNFISGDLYKGNLKSICTPSLNCWSCPGAVYSCPIGAIQNFMGYSKYYFSFYVLGFLALIVSFTGRAVCGYFCPFGLFQDLLYKLKVKKVKIYTPKLKLLKYVFLFGFVFLLPFLTSDPWFSKICPSGLVFASIPLIIVDSTLLASITYFFYIKVTIAVIVSIFSIKISRAFCQYMCPLGALFELFKPFSFYKIKVEDTCIKCDKCFNSCIMNIKVYKNDFDCIACGECVSKCPVNAIKIGYRHKEDIKEVECEA